MKRGVHLRVLYGQQLRKQKKRIENLKHNIASFAQVKRDKETHEYEEEENCLTQV